MRLSLFNPDRAGGYVALILHQKELFLSTCPCVALQWGLPSSIFQSNVLSVDGRLQI
jgi:hypothetical protein